MLLLFSFMFFSGIYVFCSTRKHLLSSLFSLEYMVVILFMMFFLFLINFGYELYFSLFFLVFSVCEGALGLSILVNLIRCYGNDLLSSFSMLSW